MSEPNVNAEEITERSKIYEKISEKVRDTCCWCTEHKEVVIAGISVGVPAVVDVMKIISKKSIVKAETKLKNNYIYDRRAGHYWELKKKPTSSDWIKVEDLRNRRPDLGLGDILQTLKLLN